LLDLDGRIVHVNERWLTLATNIGAPEPAALAVGANYFEICDQLHPPAVGTVVRCVEGLRDVLRGGSRRFVLEYRGSGLSVDRRFRLHAVPLPHASQAALAVAHFEVTPPVLAPSATAADPTRQIPTVTVASNPPP
jgi:hypothetical protein